jgi:hypothetical protein
LGAEARKATRSWVVEADGASAGKSLEKQFLDPFTSSTGKQDTLKPITVENKRVMTKSAGMPAKRACRQ